MNGQVAITDPGDPRPQVKPLCRWCARDAETTIEVQGGARFKHPLTGKMVTEPAITAPVCRACEKRLEEHKAEALKKIEAERAEKRKAKAALRR